MFHKYIASVQLIKKKNDVHLVAFVCEDNQYNSSHIFFSHVILNKILFFSVLSESLSTLTTLIRIFIFVFMFNLHLFDSFSGVCILMCLKVYSGACLLRNLPFFSHFRWMGLAKSFF
jgi:hypothetical protein